LRVDTFFRVHCISKKIPGFRQYCIDAEETSLSSWRKSIQINYPYKSTSPPPLIVLGKQQNNWHLQSYDKKSVENCVAFPRLPATFISSIPQPMQIFVFPTFVGLLSAPRRHARCSDSSLNANQINYPYVPPLELVSSSGLTGDLWTKITKQVLRFPSNPTYPFLATTSNSHPYRPAPLCGMDVGNCGHRGQSASRVLVVLRVWFIVMASTFTAGCLTQINYPGLLGWNLPSRLQLRDPSSS